MNDKNFNDYFDINDLINNKIIMKNNNFYDNFDINDFINNNKNLDNKFIKIQNHNYNELYKFLKSNKKDLYIMCGNAEGNPISMQNYSHFLFSCFFPLIEFILLHAIDRHFNFYIINFIGKRKEILNEVIFFSKMNINLYFLDKVVSRTTYITFNENLYLQYKIFSKKKDKIHYIFKIINNYDYLFLPSYDTFLGDLYYDKHNLTISLKSLNMIINFLDKISISDKIDKIYNIVIIKRGESIVNLRRIYNLENLKEKLENLIKEPVFCDIIDNLTFCEQYKLFRNSKLLIAQHGAALSNIIFMKYKNKIIEISTKSSCEYNLKFGSYKPYIKFSNSDEIRLSNYTNFFRFPRTYFMNLANYKNLEYYFLPIIRHDVAILDDKQINFCYTFIKKILSNNPKIPNIYKYVDKFLIKNDFKNYTSIYWIYVQFNDMNAFALHYIFKDPKKKKNLQKYIKMKDVEKYYEIKKIFEKINPNINVIYIDAVK